MICHIYIYILTYHICEVYIYTICVWYTISVYLTYHICEDDSPMATPPVVEPCTACDEAKYEVILSQYTSYYSTFQLQTFWSTRWSLRGSGVVTLIPRIFQGHPQLKHYPHYLTNPQHHYLNKYIFNLKCCRDEWQTQFSHMIGASHSIDYDLWKWDFLLLFWIFLTSRTENVEYFWPLELRKTGSR